MRNLLRAGVVLLVSITMFPVMVLNGAVTFWIGFGTHQTKTGVQVAGERTRGTLRYTDVLVGSGSDETVATAQPYEFTTHLSAAGPAGGCSVFTEVVTKVKPPVSVLRFQIFYPDPEKPGGRDSPNTRLQQVDYTLKAYTAGGPSQVKNEFTMKFPAGGTVSCVKLMK